MKKIMKKILDNHQLWLSNKSGERADLSSANLSSANLRGADLRGADLRNTDLSSANLSNADLRGADLRGADLRNTDLRNADLSSANLIGANLHLNHVSDGNYHHVTNIGSEKGVLELYSCGVSGWIVKRGCFIGTKEEFISKVKETHGNNEHAKKYLLLIEALTD